MSAIVIKRDAPIVIQRVGPVAIRRVNEPILIQRNPPSSSQGFGGPLFDDPENFVWRF